MIGEVDDDSAKFWLKDFVNKVGSKLASELLEGAGEVARWNNVLIVNDTTGKLASCFP